MTQLTLTQTTAVRAVRQIRIHVPSIVAAIVILLLMILGLYLTVQHQLENIFDPNVPLPVSETILEASNNG